jgi:hypothetical protein
MLTTGSISTLAFQQALKRRRRRGLAKRHPDAGGTFLAGELRRIDLEVIQAVMMYPRELVVCQPDHAIAPRSLAAFEFRQRTMHPNKQDGMVGKQGS